MHHRQSDEERQVNGHFGQLLFGDSDVPLRRAGAAEEHDRSQASSAQRGNQALGAKFETGRAQTAPTRLSRTAFPTSRREDIGQASRSGYL